MQVPYLFVILIYISPAKCSRPGTLSTVMERAQVQVAGTPAVAVKVAGFGVDVGLEVADLHSICTVWSVLG